MVPTSPTCVSTHWHHQSISQTLSGDSKVADFVSQPLPTVYCTQALLAFEESQGAVIASGMSTREIRRLPTKAFDPAHSTCQIFFRDYMEGENLRILPCLPDYHVKCIDRWSNVGLLFKW
uniref:RING-type domain-containing protein n=1 Tax=Paramormyrops kingsleyae TaxID=1676925 RepID=A0A3B3RRP5_9TELE